jgi:hypothetical protein
MDSPKNKDYDMSEETPQVANMVPQCEDEVWKLRKPWHDDPEEFEMPLRETWQIEEFRFYNGDRMVTDVRELVKNMKKPDKWTKIWVGYRDIEDRFRKKDLELAKWSSIYKDSLESGEDYNVLRDYFIKTNWEPCHLPQKWNAYLYYKLAKLLKNADECTKLVEELEEN